MLSMNLNEALHILARDIYDEVIKRLHSRIGINPRTGSNTLIGSDLEKSIDVKVKDEETLEFQIADHWEYVVLGWRRTGRFPNTSHLFIKNVNDWVRRKNVRLGNMTQSQIVWYLYRRMVLEGRQIAPRPFINYDPNGDIYKILPFLQDMLDKWAEDVFNDIIKELENKLK